MTDFDIRLQQLLASGSNLTPNQRERFLRPLRQIDVACQVEETDTQLSELLKAATRVMAHQVLEVMCFHLENTLSRCRNENQRLLLTAMIAHAALNNHGIQFYDMINDESSTGKKPLPNLSYPTMKTWIIKINTATINSATSDEAAYDFLISEDKHQDQKEKTLQVYIGEQSSSADGIKSNTISITQAHLHDNPFACAAEVFGGVE